SHLRTIWAVVLQICSLQQERRRRKSSDLPAERGAFADDRKDSPQTRGNDHRLGGRAERDLSLPGRCRVSALLSRRLQRSDSICRSCEAEARIDAPWIRGGIRTRSA